MHFKKSLLTFSLFIAFTVCVNAQITMNPSHAFYEDALTWEVKGYVNKLPPVRPYPYQNIQSILESVIENGSEKDKATAQEYYRELTGKFWNIALDYEIDTNNTDIMLRFHPALTGGTALYNNMFSFGYKLGWDIRTVEEEDTILPSFSFPTYDSIQDPASIGPFSMYLDAGTTFAFGTENLFVQAGLNRNGYGNFINSNLSLNEASYHKGNLVLTYMNDNFTYFQLLSTIGASFNYDGSELRPDKYLAMHMIEIYPFKNFSFAYYETIVFGNRFDPIYLIPTPYMASQGLNGCMDNLQMGVNMSYKFLNQFCIKSDLFVDDIDFNRAVKFDFDSKNRIALQLGFEYAPSFDLLDYIELDYTAITPHTYSHWEDMPQDSIPDEYTINYQNYTNSGIKMGSQYEPNSDAITLKASFTPVKNLKIKANFDFIRHANISESITYAEAFEYLCAKENVYSTDGSIFVDSKLNNKCLETPWSQLNFLNQEHKMYIVRPSLDVSYRIPKLFGVMDTKFGLSYTYEFIHNYGVGNHLFPGGQVVLNEETGMFTYNGSDYDSTDESAVKAVVDDFRNQWINNLTDKHNHYFTIYCTMNF